MKELNVVQEEGLNVWKRHSSGEKQAIEFSDRVIREYAVAEVNAAVLLATALVLSWSSLSCAQINTLAYGGCALVVSTACAIYSFVRFRLAHTHIKDSPAKLVEKRNFYQPLRVVSVLLSVLAGVLLAYHGAPTTGAILVWTAAVCFIYEQKAEFAALVGLEALGHAELTGLRDAPVVRFVSGVAFAPPGTKEYGIRKLDVEEGDKVMIVSPNGNCIIRPVSCVPDEVDDDNKFFYLNAEDYSELGLVPAIGLPLAVKRAE